MTIKTNGAITTVIADRNKYLTIKGIEIVFTEAVGKVKRIDCKDLISTENIIEKPM